MKKQQKRWESFVSLNKPAFGQQSALENPASLLQYGNEERSRPKLRARGRSTSGQREVCLMERPQAWSIGKRLSDGGKTRKGGEDGSLALNRPGEGVEHMPDRDEGQVEGGTWEGYTYKH